MTARRAIYVATGERHRREAADSIRSLWQHHADLPVTVHVDGEGGLGPEALLDPPSPGRLEVLPHPSPTRSWADKPAALVVGGPTDERVLFLDTDTRVCGDLGEVFEVLARFELAAVHAPVRLDRRQPDALARRAPVSFPELNTGVVAFRRTPNVVRLFERWRHLHDQVRGTSGGAVGDQSTFRIALYESEVRFTVLPPEYNCRFPFPTYVHGPVRILHGR
ncbi:MAG TPA: hypothetical protein VHH92_06635, partial [Actinomycetota bacterium]|nr:hypothetical protein [Actinomycetota bacterium]